MFYVLVLLPLIRLISVGAQVTPIKPGDPYKLEGSTFSVDLDSNCLVDMAWLMPPQHLSMSYHGHESACHRVSLGNRTSKANATANMVDMASLDQLVANQQFMSKHINSLRSFFLKDRVGDYAVMVLLKGALDLKPIEFNLVDLKTDPPMKPQNILCARKHCLKTVQEQEVKAGLEKRLQQEKDTLQLVRGELVQADNRNRELVVQMVVYQVVCAVTAFLVVTLTFTALALCVKMRRRAMLKKRKYLGSFNSYGDYIPNSPNRYHLNGGKVDLTPASPFIALASDTHEATSLNNVVMTNSNLNETSRANAAYISYPISECNYGTATDGSMVTLMPVYGRQSLGGVYRNYLPGISHSSQIENKLNLSRTGSLTRDCSSFEHRFYMPSASSTQSPCETPQFGNLLMNPVQQHAASSSFAVMNKTQCSAASSDAFLKNSVFDSVKRHYPSNQVMAPPSPMKSTQD
ncbi:hypothetical protein Ciccas_011882 [Cichlidogyrus casuarinus]|uniref:Uncharacterized protein n=1 Tax=Cichlidogyrus casuarinus TaxID=1844966 RepID=A0ABD2PPZ9_9PLAT